MSLLNSSTSVDLSRLPAPTIVEQVDYETTRSEMIAEVELLCPEFDATVESDPAVKVLEVAAYFVTMIRQQFNDRARQIMIAYATDSNLDQLGALVGVSRLVISPADELAGTEAVMELDDALRRRIVLAPESFSVAGPESAYVFHALTADASLLDASATSPAPGEVVVTILSNIGNGEATADQIAAVADIVASSPIRPLTDMVTVVSAEIIDYIVAASLVLFPGPDETLILAAAQQRLASYLDSCRLLGRDITISAIYAALHVEGVQRVNLASPLADIVVDATQAGFCVGSNVTIGGYGE